MFATAITAYEDTKIAQICAMPGMAKVDRDWDSVVTALRDKLATLSDANVETFMYELEDQMMEQRAKKRSERKAAMESEKNAKRAKHD
jgi:hypothetical protein